MRVFIASPGDLLDERSIAATTIDEYNSTAAYSNGLSYEAIGWEQVRGTARRPQEEIDELIHDSHFLIALFGQSWGSHPGSPWGYTSGTEEELFTALLDLTQKELPMRDVWVAFRSIKNPDPPITELKNSISEKHALLYDTFATQAELEAKLKERLRGWEAMSSRKVHRFIDLLPSSGHDVLKAATLTIQGSQLIELGQPQHGLDKLKEASRIGGPKEKVSYARELSRRGDLPSAIEQVGAALEYFSDGRLDLYSTMAVEAYTLKADLLLRLKDPIQAVQLLESTLNLMEQTPTSPNYSAVKCRLLDSLGSAYKKNRELDRSRRSYEEALRLREGMENESEVARSLVNLARLEVGEGNLNEANDLSKSAQEKLSNFPASPLLPNAELLRAQILLRMNRAAEGVQHAKKSVVLNRQTENKRGEATALYVLAQCNRSAARYKDSYAAAHECIDLNREMHNEPGMANAQWIIDHMEDHNHGLSS